MTKNQMWNFSPADTIFKKTKALNYVTVLQVFESQNRIKGQMFRLKKPLVAALHQAVCTYGGYIAFCIVLK